MSENMESRETSGLAIGGFICSITICLGWLGLILGIVALSDINKTGKGGKGLAITAIVIGGISLLLAPISIMAAIAIPGLMRARISANEGSAIGSLRSLSMSQVQFQQQALVDQDQDGTGEFGFLAELAGTEQTRSGSVADPAFISPIFSPGPDGIARKSGYCFYVYLPDDGEFDTAMGEGSKRSTDDTDTVDMQENRFIIYAWPQRYGETGMRAFVVDQSGEIFVTPNDGFNSYNGDLNVPNFDAAFNEAKQIRRGQGKDNNQWLSVD